MLEMAKMVVVLLALTTASGYSLAKLHKVTEGPIEAQELKFVKGPAIDVIFADRQNDPLAQRFSIADEEGERTFFVATIDGRTDYVAFESTAGVGFGGGIGVMVGVNVPENRIHGVEVTTHAETPGIGSKAKDDPTFVSQFKGRSIGGTFAVKADGGNVDAISGATVTSRGVSTGLTDASAMYKRLKPKIVEELDRF